jgi:hypothetical protein
VQLVQQVSCQLHLSQSATQAPAKGYSTLTTGYLVMRWQWSAATQRS